MALVWPIVWRAAGVRMTGARTAGAPMAVVPVVSEAVLILRVALPALPKSQRRAAAAFAVEPFLAQPLEDVRVVLGPRLDEGVYLAVVIDRVVLAGLVAQAGEARLVPDALLLPLPVVGQWTVAERAGRLLARLPDGTGFAASEPGFRAIWQQSGAPGLVWLHGTPPQDLPLARRATLAFPIVPEPGLAGFDLGYGRVPAWREPRKLGALAAVLALGLCGHLALLAVEGQRLTARADGLERQVRQDLTARGIRVGTSVDAAVALALQGGNVGSGLGFLPLLGRAMGAMSGQAGSVTLQDIGFDSRSQQLSLTLVASGLGPLQDAAAALARAGLSASLGPSTLSQGQARASVAIQAGGAG